MKKLHLFLPLLFISINVFSQNITRMGFNENVGVQGGIGLGTVIAVIASWSRNKSILWAIIHGILGWLYVIYFVLTRRENQ